MTDAEHEAPVGFRTDQLEDCAGCHGKTFPGHECDGPPAAGAPLGPSWPTDPTDYGA